MPCYWNIIRTTHMLSRLLAWASQAPQRPAILTDQKTLTYQDLVEQILAYQPQESISYPTLIVKRDCFQQLIAFCYHLQHGNYPLICHPNLPEEEQRRLSSCDPPSDKAVLRCLALALLAVPRFFGAPGLLGLIFLSSKTSCFISRSKQGYLAMEA